MFSDPKDVKLVVRSKLTSRKTTHAMKSIVEPRTQVSVEVTVYIYTYICYSIYRYMVYGVYTIYTIYIVYIGPSLPFANEFETNNRREEVTHHKEGRLVDRRVK